MKMQSNEIQHVVLGADLNHHGTLFAGQGAKWLVEAGFIAAANLTAPENIVCVNVHGMLFKRPVPAGTVIRYESKVVLTGTTRIIAHVRVVKSKTEEFVVDGFLTFVHVDLKGRPMPHGIIMEATTPEEIELQERAKQLS